MYPHGIAMTQPITTQNASRGARPEASGRNRDCIKIHGNGGVVAEWTPRAWPSPGAHWLRHRWLLGRADRPASWLRACFGSPDASVVRFLRGYRDSVPIRHARGRSIVARYCREGPKWARWVSVHQSSGSVGRNMVLLVAALCWLHVKAVNGWQIWRDAANGRRSLPMALDAGVGESSYVAFN